jgi:hypothetical protein
MNSKLENLTGLWRKNELGEATAQEKIDAACLAGELHDVDSIPRICSLLQDEEALVRYFAIQTLVLDLKEKSDSMAERCWQLLRNDPDEDVRGMAATCLGSIHFGTNSRTVFDQFHQLLKNPDECAFVKRAVYRELFSLVGRHPLEWPRIFGPRKPFEESDIDWEKVAEIEAEVKRSTVTDQ